MSETNAVDVIKQAIDDAIDPLEAALATAKEKVSALPDGVKRTLVLGLVEAAAAAISAARAGLNIPDNVGGDQD